MVTVFMIRLKIAYVTMFLTKKISILLMFIQVPTDENKFLQIRKR